MIEINLVPDVKQEFLRAQRTRNTVISIAIIVGIAAVAAIVLISVIVGGQLALSSLNDRTIATENRKLQSVEDLNETVTLQNQLKQLATMHDQNTINSRIFDILTAINPPAPNDVTVSNFQLDPENNAVSIEGSAVNGYAAVEVFKKTILNTEFSYSDGGERVKDPLADTVNVSETSYGEDSEGRKVLRFVVSFTYPENLLSRTITDAKIVSPTSEINVTDSFIRVPNSLFAERPADYEGEDE